MPTSRNKIYLMLSIACVAGYIWLITSLTSTAVQQGINVCFIKRITTIPCPSCGSTRSLLCLLHGDVIQALLINPLGIVIAVIMLLTPVWLLYDFLFKKSSLYMAYQKMERIIRKPTFAIPLIALITLNWIWNITKGL
jgi:Protein of unknown function (DUF2752)